MVEKDNELVIKLCFDTTSLYDIAYLFTDIYQLIIYAELVEKNEYKVLEDIFYTPRFPYITRYIQLLRDNTEKALVTKIEKGSIEFYISVASFLATILVPLVMAHVKKQVPDITFEISAGDKELSNLLERMSDASDGITEATLKWLFHHLGKRGYSVEIISEDIYRITQVLNRYERRLIKTFRKK